MAFTFDMDADSILHLAHHRSADTRVAAASLLRYGPEVATPRLDEIAAHVEALSASGEWTPRADRMPFYPGPIPELGDAEPGLAL